MKDPPKLILELKKNKLIFALFENFEIAYKLLPSNLTERLSYFDEVEFDSFTSRKFQINCSKYYKWFILEFEVHLPELFQQSEIYCTNKTHPIDLTLCISGNRSKRYCYIEKKYYTDILIIKMANDFVQVRLSHSLIPKTSKRNPIENIKLNGELTINYLVEQKIPLVEMIQDQTEEQIRESKNWTNVNLLNKIRELDLDNRMETTGLYSCRFKESKNQIRQIYISELHKNKLLSLNNNSKQMRINIEGEFKRIEDSILILNTINKVYIDM